MLISSQSGMTGNVVSERTNALSSIFGLVFVIGGLGLMMTGRWRLEYLLDPREFVENIEKAEPDSKKRSVILDTSALINYSPNEIEENILKRFDEIFIPKSVLNEIYDPKKGKGDKEKRNLFEDKKYKSKCNTLRVNVKGNIKELYSKYKRISREHLKNTEKAKMYEKVFPIFDDIVEGRKNTDDLKQKDLEFIGYHTRKIKELAKRKDKTNLRGKGMEGITKIRDYLKRNCKISDTDIDVLSMGLYQAKHHKKHAIIGEKDVDFEEVINYLKGKNHKISSNLDYVNTYKKDKVA